VILFVADNEEIPGSYILTNKVRDVTNWAGANVTMPGINFTICFWAKIDSWHERRSTILSLATSGVRNNNLLCLIILKLAFTML